MLPKRVLYYGRDEELPAQLELRAGPLALFYEQGDLRRIRLGDTEILRRIYVAVRDSSWGTVPALFSNVHMLGSVLHPHAVEERVRGRGRWCRCNWSWPAWPRMLLCTSAEGLRRRRVGGTLQDVGAVGDAAPA